MLRPITLEELREVELIPQAVLRRPISFFEERLGIHFVRSHDDLDSYQAAAFSIDGKLPFALKHYRGHPAETTTVYLSSAIRDVQKVSAIIRAIVDELKVPRDAVEWQRSDDPNL